MRDNLQCNCHICKVERQLLVSLSEPPGSERFSRLRLSVPLLASFECPSALIEHLHSQRDNESRPPSANDILSALIQTGPEIAEPETSQSVLILAFMPTIHRTYREVRAWYRDLPSEDIAQQILTYFLELAASAPVGLIDGQLSFLLARSLRRNALRWAQKETLLLLEREKTQQELKKVSVYSFEENFETVSLLNDFLDYAVRIGILSQFERDLLIKLKIDGFLAKEVTDTNTVLSEKAVHSRVERIMYRLQKAARRMSTKKNSASQSAADKHPQKGKNISPEAGIFSLGSSAEFLAIGKSRRQFSPDSSPKQSTSQPQNAAAIQPNSLSTFSTLPSASGRTRER